MIQNIQIMWSRNSDEPADGPRSDRSLVSESRNRTGGSSSSSEIDLTADNASLESPRGMDTNDPICIHDHSDSSEVDLCESDHSEVEFVGISQFPNSNRSLPSNEPERRVRDVSPLENMIIHFPWGSNSSSEPFDLSMFQHIQERIRTQAMLIERLRLFNVDTRPTIPPKTIINSMKVAKIKDTAEAASLGSCPICLEAYRPRMSVRILPGCGHMVHKPCMDKWITKSLKYTCPLDNKAIDIPETAVVVERPLRRSTRNRSSQ
jgi:hypothetical protein